MQAAATNPIALNLSRAVQLTVDIGSHIISTTNTPAPETMGQTFEILAQQKVHSIARAHLQDFMEFAKNCHSF